MTGIDTKEVSIGAIVVSGTSDKIESFKYKKPNGTNKIWAFADGKATVTTTAIS
jgi:hypothetical protein